MSVILKAGGERTDLVDDGEAQEIINRLQAQRFGNDDSGALLSLDLSCRSYGPSSMTGILAFLGDDADKSIEALHLADIIASRETEDGLAVMGALADKFANAAQLRCLDMADNALGDRAMDRLEILLRNKINLKRINFRNCGLGLHSIKVLKGALVENSFAMAKNLTDLVLDKNMLGVDGAQVVGEILTNSVSLEHFSYVGCRPQRAGSQHICNGLAACKSTSLRYLDLDDCTVGNGSEEEDGVDALCTALERSSGLRFLNLPDSELGPEGLEKVMGALIKSKAALTHLNLESNEIGSEGVTELTKYVKMCASRTLVELNMESNELEDDGLIALLAPFRADWNVLEVLNVSQNELDEKSSSVLISAAGDFPSLKLLNVQDNDEMPLRELKKVYKGRIAYGDDDDDDEEEEEGGDVSALHSLLSKMHITK